MQNEEKKRKKERRSQAHIYKRAHRAVPNTNQARVISILVGIFARGMSNG